MPVRCRTCSNFRRNVLPSELTNTIELFTVYVHRNEALSPTFRYIKPMYLRLKNIYKNPPQKYHVTYLLLFVRSWAPLITLLIAGALTDIQQPAAASNVCTTDARLGGVGRVPPSSNKKILATPMTVKRERER